MVSIIVNTDNATPTATTIDLLPLAKSRLGVPRGDTSKDQELCDKAIVAMAKYAQLAPLVKRFNLSVVPNQLSYPLAADTRKVLDVAVPTQIGYYNDWVYLPMIDTPASTLFGTSSYAFRNPSERLIRQQILGELDHYTQSFTGYYVDGSPPQLYILPVPSSTSAQPVIVRYAADYPNVNPTDPYNPSWLVLPAGHWAHVLTLIKWAVMDARADMVATSLSITEPQGGNSILTDSWKMSNRAERLLNDVAMALGVFGGVAIRS